MIANINKIYCIRAYENKHYHMPQFKFSKEEQEILKAFNQGKLKRSPNFRNQKNKLEAAAKKYFG